MPDWLLSSGRIGINLKALFTSKTILSNVQTLPVASLTVACETLVSSKEIPLFSLVKEKSLVEERC